jgi:hypothetical protein
MTLRARHGLGLAIAVGWLGVLVVGTLTPGGMRDPARAGGFSLCLICGDTGGADAVLNLILFVPLGVWVGLRRGPLAALLAGILLSSGIEIIQFWVPGRYSTLGDLAWNSLGATAGATALSAVRSWLNGPQSKAARVVALGVPAVGLSALGFALEPARTTVPYVAEWTPAGTYLEQYGGQILRPTLNGEPIPNGPFPGDSDPDAVLAGDWTLEARVVMGVPPTSMAPILRMYADNGMLILGADGDDLVWRQRLLARVLHLSYTDFRAYGLLADHAVGDTIAVGAARSGCRRRTRARRRRKVTTFRSGSNSPL